MSASVIDSFTDATGTAIASHTAESGGAITVASGGAQITAANRCRSNNAGLTAISYATALSSASDSVVADFYVASQDGNPAGLDLRIQANGNRYTARFDNGGVDLFVWVAGSATNLGTVSYPVTAGSTYRMKFTAANGAQTIQISTDGGATYTTVLTRTDSQPTNFPNPGGAGLHFYGTSNSDTAGIHCQGLAAWSGSGAATAFTLEGPTSGTVGAASKPFAVAPNGSYAGTITPASSGTGSFAGTSVTFHADPVPAKFTYTAGTANGSPHAISATASPSLTAPSSINYTISGLTIAPNHPAWANSPSNWVVSANAAISADFGAKRTISFTGSANAVLAFDTSVLVANGVSPSAWPQIAYAIDNGIATTVTIASTVAVGSGLATNTAHTLVYEIVGGDYTVDSWNTPVQAVRAIGLTLDSGATVSAPAIYPDSMVVYGDSITAGGPVPSNETYVKALGAALFSEVGPVGKPSQGWTIAGFGNEPVFPSTWNYNWSGQARNLSGLKRVAVVHGTNDGLQNATDSAVTTAVTNWLSAARAALGQTVWIHFLIPPGGFKRSAITAGVAAYRTANPSDWHVPPVHDLGTLFQVGLSGPQGTPTNKSTQDGIHPTVTYQGQYGAGAAAMIAAAEAGSPIAILPPASSTVIVLPSGTQPTHYASHTVTTASGQVATPDATPTYTVKHNGATDTNVTPAVTGSAGVYSVSYAPLSTYQTGDSCDLWASFTVGAVAYSYCLERGTVLQMTSSMAARPTNITQRNTNVID